MTDRTGDDVRASYDRVAHEYARHFSDELEHKPLDRQLLDRFAEEVRGLGTVCDLGCGPGHVAHYLHERGVPIVGVDLSAVMVEEARRLNPGIEFRRGDLRALEIGDGACGGIVAFYSIIHVPRPEVRVAFGEMWRVLRSGGLLLLAFHIGDETLHRDEWWGEPVSVDFHFFRTEVMVALLRAAGFEVVEVVQREPYPDVEYPSRRAYLFAWRPEAAYKVGDANRSPEG